MYALMPMSTAPLASGVPAIGVTWSLESSVLGERRTINVYLPPDYGAGSARYPVLYIPDGGMAEDFPAATSPTLLLEAGFGYLR
jgi:predicted alpha/beta superfamily hydrolase